VVPQILAKYAGAYDFKPPDRPELNVVLTVTLDANQLTMDMDGGPKRPLTPLSETKFFFAEGGATLEFVKDDQGAVTAMAVSIVEGTFKAPRHR
jgi:hypothetical protein